MKAWGSLIALAGLSLLLSGCWSKMELTERAFVLAIAIDKGKEETLEVTAQIYRPVSQFGAPSAQATAKSFVNVTLDGTSVSTIIRNTKTVSGRHSQFSHIQILLISEEIARERLSSILDFFYRDPEIRLGTPIMIARGKARDYLTGKSMIENTLGSQVFKQLEFSSNLAGRAVNTTILDLAFRLKSESASAMLPIIMHDRQFRQDLVQGIALAKPDRMVGRIAPDKAAYLLLMANEYKHGVLEVPCDRESAGKMDAIEILKARSKVTPVLKGDALSARVDVKIDASIGELVCTTIRDTADEARYAERVERYFKEQLENVLDTLQKQKVDVLGIGHKIYLRHPSRWKKLKPEWPERYARMPIEVSVKVDLVNSKMMNPGPFSRIGED
jgi:spore germination protein KC